MTDWYKSRTLAVQPPTVPAKTDWYGQRAAGSGPIAVPSQAAIPPAPENDVPGKLGYLPSAAVAGTVGLPNTILQFNRETINQGIRSGKGPFGMPVPKEEVGPSFLERHTISPQEVMDAAQKHGMATRAETAGGRIAQDVGVGVLSAIPAAITGDPLAAALALSTGGAAGGTTSTLNEAGASPTVQALSGIIIPLVGMKTGGLLLQRTPTNLLAAAIKAGRDRPNFSQELTKTVELMKKGATFGEGLNKVTDGAFPNLLTYQRVAEKAPGGQDILGPFMAKRLEQNTQAINQQVGQLPTGDAGLAVPGNVQEAAKSVVQQARDETNAMSRPAYNATTGTTIRGPGNVPPGQVTVPTQAFGQLVKEYPNLLQVIKAVRANPTYYGNLEGLPDSSFTVLDQAKKYLNDTSEVAKREGANYGAQNAGNLANALRDAMVTENPRYASALNIQSIRQSNVEQPLQTSPVGQLAEAKTPSLGNIQSTLRLRAEKSMPATAVGPDDVGLAVRRIAKENPAATKAALGQIMNEDFQNVKDTARPGYAMQQAGSSWRYRLFGSSGSEAEMRWKAAVENSVVGKDGKPDLAAGRTKWQGMMGLLDTLDAEGYRLPPGSNTMADTKATAQLSESRLPNPLSPGELNPLSSKGWLSQKWDDYFFGRNTSVMAELLANKKSVPYWAALAKIDPKSQAARSLAAALLGTTAVSPLRLGSAPSP